MAVNTSVKIFGAWLASALLSCCNVQEDDTREDPIPTSQETAQDEHHGIRTQNTSSPRSKGVAHDGWRLRETHPGRTTFRVSFPQGNQHAAAFGVIATDGSQEILIKKIFFTDEFIAEARDAYSEVEARFPSFSGFTKFISAGPLGHHIADGEEIFEVSYYSNDPEILCYGHNHGTFRCFWGTPSNRHQLIFDWTDIRAAMRHVRHHATGQS